MSYANLDYLREFGITGDMLSESRAQAYLDLGALLIEKHCGQWFEPRYKQLRIPHGTSRIVSLPLFLISLDTNPDVAILIDGAPCYTDDPVFPQYVLYNTIPDDWGNPKIDFLQLVFDFQRVDVSGTWGVVQGDYTDPSNPVYSTPEAIKLANVQVAAELYQHDHLGGLPSSMKDFVRLERTDRHEYMMSEELFKHMPVLSFLPFQTQLLLEPFLAPPIL